jgi:hypothetical protein
MTNYPLKRIRTVTGQKASIDDSNVRYGHPPHSKSKCMRSVVISQAVPNLYQGVYEGPNVEDYRSPNDRASYVGRQTLLVDGFSSDI